MPDPAPTPDPAPLDGQALYSVNCGDCHTGPARFAGISAAGISGAITAVSSMTFLSTLSQDELQAIAAYLATQ